MNKIILFFILAGVFINYPDVYSQNKHHNCYSEYLRDNLNEIKVELILDSDSIYLLVLLHTDTDYMPSSYEIYLSAGHYKVVNDTIYAQDDFYDFKLKFRFYNDSIRCINGQSICSGLYLKDDGNCELYANSLRYLLAKLEPHFAKEALTHTKLPKLGREFSLIERAPLHYKWSYQVKFKENGYYAVYYMSHEISNGKWKSINNKICCDDALLNISYYFIHKGNNEFVPVNVPFHTAFALYELK